MQENIDYKIAKFIWSVSQEYDYSKYTHTHTHTNTHTHTYIYIYIYTKNIWLCMDYTKGKASKMV